MANLSLKNLELCEELTHVDDLAQRLETDKEHVLEAADVELQESKVGTHVPSAFTVQTNTTLLSTHTVSTSE